MSEPTTEAESEPIGTRTRVPPKSDDGDPTAERDERASLSTRTRAP